MHLILSIILFHIAEFLVADCREMNSSGPLRTNFSEFDMSEKYKYLGCYEQVRNDTDLPHIVPIESMSRARCYMYCMDRGNLFFGLSGDTCYCGDSYGSTRRRAESACSSSCGLEPEEKCGGVGAVSVFIIIEKFIPMGCFLQWYQMDADHTFLGDNFTKLGCALTCQREVQSLFFGLKDGHKCDCVRSVNWFLPKADEDCLGPCLEPQITRCGKNGLMSVYQIQYASSMSRMLGSYISFMGEGRQILVNISSATLPGVTIAPNADLFLQLYSEDAQNNGRFNELIGRTPSARATSCPENWLGFSMPGQGYRCYLLADRPALNWTGALQRCWQLGGDLFYKEEESELGLLANSSATAAERWIGMYMEAGSAVFTSTGDTTALNGRGSRRVPSLAENGCVRLESRSGVTTRHSCAASLGFVCKRFGSLHSSWNYGFPKAVRAHRQMRLVLRQVVNGSASPHPVLQLNFSLQLGNSHTLEIPSCPGCHLSYSTIERVPMKLCSPEPPGAAAPAFYRCQQPGNSPAQVEFGQTTCPAESFISRGIGEWLQPPRDWRGMVWYSVSEVHVNNRLNLSLQVESNEGVKCRLADSYPPTWQKFVCNFRAKGLTVLATETKYPYMHLCDLQVFGTLRNDFTAPPLEVSQLGQTDRFVDLKVLGVFRQNSDGTFSPDEPLQADDLKLKIYYENKLLTVLHPRHSDYFSIPLKYPQSSNKMLIFSAILSSRTGAPVQLASCTAALTIGTVKCRLLNGMYIIFKIRERINLHSCSQSSQLLPVDYCENAFDFHHADSHQFGRCAQTKVSYQPWWKARVHPSFVFEQLTLYSRRDNRQWTRHFSVSIELTVCVKVINGSEFEKKTFDCHLAGTEITVTALADRASLSLCELVAYGRPGGCGSMTFKSRGDQCNGRLRSHLHYGSKPYETALRCQWLIGGSSTHSVLLTFPEFRTASDRDYVDVYEGRGTSGKLIKRFYGNGEHRPKYPWITAQGLTNYLKADASYMTVVFVTDRAPASRNRSVETHKGFTVEAHMVMRVRPSYLRESEGTVCSSELYLYYRESFCRNRNGVHPIFKYGYRTGLSMVRELEQDLRRRQNRSLTDSDSSYFSQILSAPSGQTQALLRRKREVSQSVLRRHYCYSDEAIRREPNWRQKCCCGSCSRLFFIVQCRHPYESVPSGSCDLHWERLPLRLTD